MFDVSAGDLWRTVACVYHFADTRCICPVPADNTDELLNVVPSDREDRKPGHLVELRATKFVAVLGGMIELVLDQRHELSVIALSAVIGVQGDDEVRH